MDKPIKDLLHEMNLTLPKFNLLGNGDGYVCKFCIFINRNINYALRLRIDVLKLIRGMRKYVY